MWLLPVETAYIKAGWVYKDKDFVLHELLGESLVWKLHHNAVSYNFPQSDESVFNALEPPLLSSEQCRAE